MILRIGSRSPRRNSRLILTSHSWQTGFTFIELVLVTIIILILAGLSPPIFRKSFSAIQLKTTSLELVQLMRYAQAKSVAERSFFRINFDFTQPGFWLSAQDETSPDKFNRINGKWGQAFLAPHGISITVETENKQGSYISFYPDGSSDQAKVKIIDSRGKGFEITTQRMINYVEIKR